MENSGIIYLQFSVNRKMSSELRICKDNLEIFHNFAKENYGRGIGCYMCKDNKTAPVVGDGETQHRTKYFNGMKCIAETHEAEKRNERERCRVRAVNEAFCRLRHIVPTIASRRKRVSKVKTLRKALQYITELERMLKSLD